MFWNASQRATASASGSSSSDLRRNKLTVDLSSSLLASALSAVSYRDGTGRRDGMPLTMRTKTPEI